MKKTGIYILLTILFSLVCSSNAFCVFGNHPTYQEEARREQERIDRIIKEERERLERIRDEERRVEKEKIEKEKQQKQK